MIGFENISYSFAESENATVRLVIISGQFAAGVSGSVRVTSASGTATCKLWDSLLFACTLY